MNEAHIVNPEGLLPRGISDFAELVRQQHCFIDKSLLMQELLQCGDKVVLITRPRRFGKTINLSMLRYFLETLRHDSTDSTGQSNLFDGLLIAQNRQALQHQGKYPVISLTLKNVKLPTWSDAFDELCSLIHREITSHKECLDFRHVGMEPDEEASFERILNRQQATQADWRHSLQLLCKVLTLYHKQSPWLLLDEYDTPIHAAYVQSQQDEENIQDKNSYYRQMITFMRGLLGTALKGNDTYLHKAIITGILRVAKEDIFSDLNNLGAYGVMDDLFSRFFGFTPTEVQQLLQKRQLGHTLPAVSQWYNGYLFGEDHPVTLFNPWSVVSYAANPTRQPKEYWVNTGSTSLIDHLLKNRSNNADKQAIETLLLGNSIQRDVADNLPLRELEGLGQALWSILLTSGYVTPTAIQDGVIGKLATLRIPNQEVYKAFQRLVLSWFKQVPDQAIPSMLQALLEGNIPYFAKKLNLLLSCSLSFYDCPPAPTNPHEQNGTTQKQIAKASEHSYHMLVLGLVSHLNANYRVRSNRESGKGRPDLLLIPTTQNEQFPGIVMEFKLADSEDHLQQAAKTALEQIKEKRYAAEFADHPSTRLLQLGIAFCNKQAVVASAGQTERKTPQSHRRWWT